MKDQQEQERQQEEVQQQHLNVYYQVTCHCQRIGGKFVLPPTLDRKNNDNTNGHCSDGNDDKEKEKDGSSCSNNNCLVAWDCNCSDCSMRGNVHIIVPKSDFQIVMPRKRRSDSKSETRYETFETCETFEDATILYEWGTKAAKRRFCKTCGILPWYIPRSNPDGIAITLNCIDWGSGSTSINNNASCDDAKMPFALKPKVEIKKFDGINWEESFQASKISDQSKAR